ncbi:MAG: MOSC N-terminal beta barrel domain-containing protein, partial [Myxococcota bacterium]
MTISVSGLTVYPIKSARGIVHTTAHLDDFGFWMDRRWMLVQPDGRFLSQRTLPTMALLETTLEAKGTLTVRHIARPSSSALTLAVPNAEAATCEVEVWGDRCVALLAEASAHTWFTQALGVDCRAVYMPTTTHRPVANDAQTRVSFSDGYPLLVISEASLEDLNQRLAAPLPMNRF